MRGDLPHRHHLIASLPCQLLSILPTPLFFIPLLLSWSDEISVVWVPLSAEFYSHFIRDGVFLTGRHFERKGGKSSLWQCASLEITFTARNIDVLDFNEKFLLNVILTSLKRLLQHWPPSTQLCQTFSSSFYVLIQTLYTKESSTS